MSGSDDVHCGTDKRLAMPTSNNALDTPPAEKSEKSDCDVDDAKNTPLSEFDEKDVEALNSDSDHYYEIEETPMAAFRRGRRLARKQRYRVSAITAFLILFTISGRALFQKIPSADMSRLLESSFNLGYSLGRSASEGIIHYPLGATQLDNSMFDRCDRTTAGKIYKSGFNITHNAQAGRKFQLRDFAYTSKGHSVVGQVKVTRGDMSQRSDIEATVVFRTDNSEALAAALARRMPDGVDFEYPSWLSLDPHACMDIDVLISVRPWPILTLDLLDIQTNHLPIYMNGAIPWVIRDLRAHSGRGAIILEEDWGKELKGDTLVVHNITLSSKYGLILDRILPLENLNLRTEQGRIGVGPDMDFQFKSGQMPSSQPHPKSIHISSISGPIAINTKEGVDPPGEATPRLHIETLNNDIYAEVYHGSYTNLSTGTGEINARIQPIKPAYWSGSSEIYTSTKLGDIEAYIEDPASSNSANGDALRPLPNIFSQHTAENGSLIARYPSSWFGKVEAKIDEGPLSLFAPGMHERYRSGRRIKGFRGEQFYWKSSMLARVGTGELDVRIGL